MPANDFLQPGTTTTLTLLYDRPREGNTRYGPFRAYRVRTPDGAEHTFLPPRSLFGELDQLRLGRGSHLSVRTSQRVSRDGRAFQQYAVVAAGSLDPSHAPAASGMLKPAPAQARLSPDRASMLACVALKAAAGLRPETSNVDDVLTTAAMYLTWLEKH